LFSTKEVKILHFISEKITTKVILYIKFSYKANNELSAVFVESKTGNKLKILRSFECYKTIDFHNPNITIRFRN